MLAFAIAQLDVADFLQIASPLWGETNEEWEPPLAFVNLAHLAATDDCDCIENIPGIESITRDLVSLYDDPQVGQTTCLLGLHIGGSLHPGECPHHLFAFFAECFEIIAIEADADIGTDTGHQLCHTQLDRLAEAVGVAGNLILEGLFHGGD